MPISENNFFSLSFTLSFLIHVCLITFFSLSPKTEIFHKISRYTEVVYLNTNFSERNTAKPKEKTVIKEDKRGEEIKVAHKISGRLPLLDEKIKDLSKLNQKLILDKEKSALFRSPEADKKIIMPLPMIKELGESRYFSYNQIIRQKIKDRAYTHIHNSQFDDGIVYLTFILLSNGMLKNIKIIEEKTMANEFLKDISVSSVKEATPFPPFPDDVKYSELSISVPISFKVE